MARQPALHRAAAAAAAPVEDHRLVVLGQHHRRGAHPADQLHPDHVPVQDKPCADACPGGQQQGGQPDAGPHPPPERQPAQTHQAQADQGGVAGVEGQLGPRPARHHPGPAVQQPHQKGRAPGAGPADGPQRRRQPGQGRGDAQHHHGLDQPEHRHPRQQSVGAGAQPPQHQHREGGRRSAEGDAPGLPKGVPGPGGQPHRQRPARSVLLPGGMAGGAAADQLRPGQGARHRRKGQLEADVADGITVEGAHPQPAQRQAGQGVGGGHQPDPQRPDADRRPRPQHRRGEPGDAGQQRRQHHRPQRSDPLAPHYSRVKAAPGRPGRGQLQPGQPDPQPPVEFPAHPAGEAGRQQPALFQPFSPVHARQGHPAQDGHVHPADHQHVGQPRRPVGAVQFAADAGAVPYDHGRQGAGFVPFQPLAQRLAEAALEPGRPGAEAGARAQPAEPALVPGQERHFVGVAAGPVCRGRRLQAEPALDLLPGTAQRQPVALAAEGRRLSVHLRYPQPGPDGGAGIALLDVLHRGGEPDRPPAVSRGQGVELRPGAGRKGQPQRRAQQQPEPPAPGPAPGQQHQQPQTKKSRKGPKARLRLKSSDQLRAQRTGKQHADRPPHPISGRTGAAAPGR